MEIECPRCWTELEPDADSCPRCGATIELCCYCGLPSYCYVHEYWPESRTFQLDTCCEGRLDDARIDIAEQAKSDPREAGRQLEAHLLEHHGIRCPVRQVVVDEDAAGRYGNGGICVDFGLRLEPIAQRDAKRFIHRHHRHNERPAGSKINLAVYNGDELVAVLMAGIPVARMTMQRHPDWIEVTRLCVDASLPQWVAWNACSMLYGAAAREAKARGYARIITYTREDETGHTLVASGWVQTRRTKPDKRNWARAGRKARKTRMTPCYKRRWERGLNKRERRAVAADAARFEQLERRRAEREAKAAAKAAAAAPPPMTATGQLVMRFAA